jgi:hypothetical protein
MVFVCYGTVGRRTSVGGVEYHRDTKECHQPCLLNGRCFSPGPVCLQASTLRLGQSRDWTASLRASEPESPEILWHVDCRDAASRSSIPGRQVSAAVV